MIDRKITLYPIHPYLDVECEIELDNQDEIIKGVSRLLFRFFDTYEELKKVIPNLQGNHFPTFDYESLKYYVQQFSQENLDAICESYHDDLCDEMDDVLTPILLERGV